MKVRLLAAVFSILALSSTASAQNATGRVIGNVTDPQGAAIANARITVTNAQTHVSRETATDNNGQYQVLDLPIGMYTVTAEAPGFAKSVTAPKELFINESLRFDVTLSVGAVTETVQVQSQALMVETVNPTLGNSVTTAQIEELPLNGRNTLDLARYAAPGVLPSNPGSPSTAGPTGGTTNAFSIAGMRSDSVTYLLDGGNNNNLLSNGVVLDPNPDTVQEFRLLTSNYTAEYGRNAGGIVSVVTKSGTNTLHGSLFEFVRNNDFNANLFFNNANGIPRPILKRNQFGGTLGGPVVIPKVVHGKDKFFWFFGYQGTRLSALTQNPSVTT